MPIALDHGLIYLIGVFWASAYALVIRRALLDRAHGMPMVAMCANICWEFIFSFIIPHRHPLREVYIVCLILDLGILFTYLRYGRKEFPKDVSPKLFVPTLIAVTAVCFSAIILITQWLDDHDGLFTSFPQCLMMSFLFVRMLDARGSPAGQSIYIAITKWLGTLLACVFSIVYWPTTYILYLFYTGIFFYDALYIFRLHRAIRAIGEDPWRRL